MTRLSQRTATTTRFRPKVARNRRRQGIANIRTSDANFLTLKMSHTCTYRSTAWHIHPMLAITSITFFFCGWWSVIYMKYEINRKQWSKCYTFTESSLTKYWDRSKTTFDRRGPGRGPGSVLTLSPSQNLQIPAL